MKQCVLDLPRIEKRHEAVERLPRKSHRDLVSMMAAAIIAVAMKEWRKRRDERSPEGKQDHR